MRSASSVRMTAAPGIGTSNHEPDQSMVFAGGIATSGLIGNSVPAMNDRQFRQKWQAVLEGLESFEGDTGKDDESQTDSAGFVSAATSGLRLASGVPDRKRLEGNGMSESSARPTHPSESMGANRKGVLQVLTSAHLVSNADANNAPMKSGSYNPESQSRISSGGDNKPVKKGAKADSIATTSALNLQYPLTLTIVPLAVFPSQADKPLRQAPLSPVLSDSTARPSGKQLDSRATRAINPVTDAPGGGRTIPAATPDVQHVGYPWSASVPSLVASRDAGAEVIDGDQAAIASQMKPAVDQVDPSIAGPQPFHNSSNGQTNSEPASSAIELGRLPIAPPDNSFEQGKESAAPSGAALNPKNFQGDRPALRETATPSRPKLAMEGSAMRVVATGAAAQEPGDARAGQSTVVPGAGIVQVHGNESAVAANERLAPMREPFTIIDAGAESAATKWVVAGGHRAEAGFQDSALGWVSVRAQAGAGGIHAAVVPSSEVAAQALSGHLIGLNAHLASRYERLNPVTLSTPDLGASSRDAGQEMFQGRGAGTGQEGQQRPTPENPETMQGRPVAQVSRGTAEDLQSGATLQAFTAGSNRIDGHVSFVV